MSTKSELKYHIVWCTKYRRKVLSEDIQKNLNLLIKEICENNKFEIELLEIKEDCIQLFIKAPVKDSVHRIISQIKGFTSFRLRQSFPELKSKLPCLWTRSYYAETIGYVSEEIVKKYVEDQKNV